jgi:hypothetical protein
MRSSIERETMRSFGKSSVRESSTPASPTPTRASASARLVAPMSTQRSVNFEARSRSSVFIRWIGFLPTTPSTSPSVPRKRIRCPTSTCGSHPPIGEM